MATRAVCKYGTACYRRNPQHFLEFSHPWKDTANSDVSASSTANVSTASNDNTVPAAKRVKREATSDPFHFLLTKVRGIKDEFNQFLSIGIKDILSAKHGKLKQSIQFNYMFDVDWLVSKYPNEFQGLPLFIVHQDKLETVTQLEQEVQSYPNIKLVRAHLIDPFGTHHTKMMILHYENGLRVVIHTANLIERDWDQKTQGVWFSPLFPPSVASSFVDSSPTNFQTDLIEYLKSYRSSEIDIWCELIKKYDMSAAKVFLVASSPGRHTGNNIHKFGHMKVRNIFSKYALSREMDEKWPVIGQFSSIGTLGSLPDQWLTGEFLTSMKTSTPARFCGNVPLKLIFPCVEDVRKSLEGYMAGGSLPYSEHVAKKQPYLKLFLNCWRSSRRGRDRASPHIKTYTRISPEMNKIAWFMVTSANLSKAAWGALEKNGSQLAIRSYELGVLFIPKMFGDQQIFNVCDNNSIEGNGVDAPFSFSLPFDVPLVQYSKTDMPWICNIEYKEPDSNGNIWSPS